jgi:MATE family multidrug resistance protein
MTESRHLIRLAAPLFFAQVLVTGIGVVDTLMAGQYSSVDLAAIAVGNSLWLPLLLLITGLMIATTSMVARFHGAEQLEKIVATVQQSIWLALLLAAVVIVLLLNTTGLLRVMDVEPNVASITERYLFAVAMGMPAAAFFNGLRGFTEGMGRTRPYMISSLIAFVTNIPLNYALINGSWGLPELGGAGCGWATAASMWLQGIILFLMTKNADNYQGVRLYQHWAWPEWQLIKKIAKLGFPIAIGVFAEVSIFSTIALLLAPLGVAVLGGHQIALATSHIIFMVPLSLSQALTIRVGFYLGQGVQREANKTAVTGIAMAFLLASMTFIIILIFRETITNWFTEDVTVHNVAVSLFLLMAIYQLPDHLQLAANACLRAYHDTRWPMVLILFSYWVICLPLGYLLSRTDYLVPAMGAEGFWLGLLVGLTLTSCCLSWRLWRIAKRPL